MSLSREPRAPQPVLVWATLVLLVVLILAIGVLLLLRQAGQEAPVVARSPLASAEGPVVEHPGQAAMHLYFLSRKEPLLVEEVRWIPEGGDLEGMITEAVAALAAGSTDEALLSPLPPGTRLLSCYYEPEEKCAVLDLSAECVDGQPGDTFSEWATIYALVDTVASLSPRIEQVLLLCEGDPVRKSPGNWDWLYPFKPDMTFVRYRPSEGTS